MPPASGSGPSRPKDVTWADFWADEAVSAFKQPLFRRPQRAEVPHRSAKPATTSSSPASTACFRSMHDFVTAYKLLRRPGG